MNKISSAILLYKTNPTQFFLVHPGGPFWARKDLGAWSIPKGEVDSEQLAPSSEQLIENAIRELREETGVNISDKSKLLSLGETKLKSGKVIHAWGYEYNDQINLESNSVEIEWPPRSGKKLKFPEVDRGEWFNFEEASQKINPAQIVFLERLKDQ